MRGCFRLNIRYTFFPIAIIFLFSLLNTKVVLAQEKSEETNSFYVQAVIPQNQVDLNKSYFDLRILPEAEQELQVKLVNPEDEPISISVNALNATTTEEGMIDYTLRGVKDKSLKYPFESLIKVLETNISLQPYETKIARFHLKMPKEKYDGVIVGGLRFTKNLPESETKNKDVTINQRFHYVVGVVLNETDTSVLPDYEMDSVKVAKSKQGKKISVIHAIRNKNAAISKKMNLKFEIRKKGEETPLIKLEKEALEMAPDSVMDFPVPIKRQLQPGKYISKTLINQEGKKWAFENEFEITREQAKVINEENKETKVVSKVPMWLILVIVLLALLVLIQGYILWRKKKQN
ncbi:hypothetical protein DOK67_0001737 [Enterococcus sp. DIV0212c]|uniref:DUF916 and DUF3324 domain-containing protein n=1 Tax=Enterococcus sp. DIV0212c TaxID=2230867 RepID=UPI001A9AC729|nr:DUF916 and DUF3324 domain-containing protein [Enterococcus sp. DIV0212c]MBO1353863.1 DUF916 and DUF3324 domain-containing protein [Enterococcus sp. DIV0212c]